MIRKRLPIYQAEAKGADCVECTFNSQTPVGPERAKDHRDFTIVVDGPNGVEAEVGLPLSGNAGGWMEDVFKALGLERRFLDIHPAMSCAPDGLGLLSAASFTEGINNCRPRLVRELAQVEHQELILTMGEKAMYALTGKRGIHDWSGYPLDPLPVYKDMWNGREPVIFPTFHPSFIMREPWYWPVLKKDLERALRLNHNGITPFQWPEIYFEDDEASVNALADIYDNPGDVDVGFDVETGGKSPFTSPLLCGAIASRTKSVCVSYPFDETVEGLFRAILKSKRHKKVLQNGNHDLITCHSNDIEISNNDFDLLPASRVAFPQIDHDLGFLFRFLLFGPRYKIEFHAGKDKGDSGWLKAAKDPGLFKKMKIYCAKDAWSTVMLKEPLLELIRRLPHGP